MRKVCEYCGQEFATTKAKARFCRKGCATAKRNTEKARMRDVLVDLLARVKKHDNGCWIYQGYQLADGYGSCWYNGRTHHAHRVVFMLTTGETDLPLAI